MEVLKENQIIPTIVLKDGHTEPTLKEIGATFPDAFSFIDFLPSLEKYLEDLKSAHNESEYGELTSLLHRTIDEYINNIAVSKVVFGISNEMQEISTGKYKCNSSIFIENVDEILQKMAEYEENIKVALNAIEFIQGIPDRIIELNKKITDKKAALEELRAEKNQIIANSKQGIEDEKSVSRMKQLLADKKELESDINSFTNQLEALKHAEHKLKVTAVICLDQPMDIQKQIPELLLNFEQTQIKTDLSDDIKKSLGKERKELEFFTADPHAIKREQIEDQIRKNEIQKIAEKSNRKVKLILGIAVATVVSASAGFAYYYLSTRAKNEGVIADSEKSTGAEANEKVFLASLAEKPINYLEVDTLMPGQEGKSWLRFHVKPSQGLHEMVNKIYGDGVVIAFRTINPITKKMQEEDMLEMQFNAVCKEKNRPKPVLLIKPNEGETVEINLDVSSLQQKCDEAESKMSEAGYRITVDGNETTHFTLMEESADTANDNLQKAKRDLRTFIVHNQKLGKIGKAIPTDFIEKTESKQDLEKKFIAAMGLEAISIRRASSIRTDFYINPILKEGLQIMHGFVISGLMDKNDLPEIFSTDAIRQGFGQADSIVCDRESDFLGIVVQPGKEKNKKTRIFYPYDLDSWQTTNCVKK